MKLATSILLAASAAFAQVGAPALGFVPDGVPDGLPHEIKVRPVYGIPAAATVAAPIDYGRDFSTIAVSPSQTYALAADSASGAVFLLSSNAAPLAGASPNPDRIVLSPRGSSAGLWFASTGRLQFVSGLPGSPSIQNVDAALVGEVPLALAVADDGALAVGAFSDGLYAFGAGGPIGRIPMRERPQALAFYAGSHDLAAATRLDVFKIADAGSQAVTSTLYQGKQLDPAGIAITWDGGHLVLAQNSGSLLNLDLQAGTDARIDCGCSVEGVFPMGASIFRVTAFDGFTFRLFDASSGSLFYVPLAMTPSGGAQ
jgi:DNA-binding beta-propeller fold protein YncE